MSDLKPRHETRERYYQEIPRHLWTDAEWADFLHIQADVENGLSDDPDSEEESTTRKDS